MPRLTIDGREMEVEPGTTVLQAAAQAGTDIPHYCYHPGLSVAGNCRICLVEVEGMPTVQISCNLPVRDGMVVHTKSEKAQDARSDVMELLLINHPLDCPICDQAGECKLQEYSFELGSGASRFDVPKRHKRKNIRFSDKVVFDAERCIVCTRCVRFTQEVTKTDELTVVQRGDRSEIDVAPGGELESPYQMNVIDICPVGALTSADFRFQSRVWFMEQKRTVCQSCSRGCNVVAGTRWNRVLRLVPAENADVNQWWMCDHGRLNIKDIASEDRLVAPRVDGAVVSAADAMTRLEQALREARDAGGEGLVGLVSARLTNEECWLARRLLRDAVGAIDLDFVPRSHEGDDFLLTADRNPNATGARASGISPTGSGGGLPGLRAAIEAGKVRWLVLVGEDLAEQPELEALLDKVPFVAVIGSHETGATARAHVVLPGATWAEKDGTVTNLNGRVQRLRSLVRTPGQAVPESRWLLDLLHRLEDESVPDVQASAAALFRSMTKDVEAFEGMRWRHLGDSGSLMKGATEPTGGAAVSPEGGVPV